MVKFIEVVKRYKDVTALNGISFEIKKGSVFGLLGPNGAGKTTLIRVLNRILGIDEGEIFFNEEKLKAEHTEKIGYLPEERGLYPDMKVYEILLYLAKLKGLSSKEAKLNLDFWANEMQIVGWKNKKTKELSKGMQQKVQFIASVLHNPELLILDEPFTGLDPVNTKNLKKVIKNLNEKGTTIIFSTHRMEQVEDVCKEIVLINKGNIVLSGKINKIKQDFKKNLYLLEYRGNIPDNILQQFDLIEKHEHKLVVKLKDKTEINGFLHTVLEYAYIISFAEKLPTLDEIFIEMVGGSNEE